MWVDWQAIESALLVLLAFLGRLPCYRGCLNKGLIPLCVR